MDPDLVLTIGVVLGVLSLLALLAAWADARPPRAGAVMIMAAGALLLFAFVTKPGGYRPDDVPRAMLRVVGQVLH